MISSKNIKIMIIGSWKAQALVVNCLTFHTSVPLFDMRQVLMKSLLNGTFTEWRCYFNGIYHFVFVCVFFNLSEVLNSRAKLKRRYTTAVLFLKAEDSRSIQREMSLSVKCPDTPFLKAFML